MIDRLMERLEVDERELQIASSLVWSFLLGMIEGDEVLVKLRRNDVKRPEVAVSRALMVIDRPFVSQSWGWIVAVGDKYDWAVRLAGDVIELEVFGRWFGCMRYKNGGWSVGRNLDCMQT